MTDSNKKSAAEAERDVAEARAGLESSIEELSDRLTPSAMLDDAVGYLKGDGRKYVTALRREAETNPLPILLIGVGVAWLAIGSGRRAMSASPSRDEVPDFSRDDVPPRAPTLSAHGDPLWSDPQGIPSELPTTPDKGTFDNTMSGERSDPFADNPRIPGNSAPLRSPSLRPRISKT